MNLDLKELRSKAMAATPGPWTYKNTVKYGKVAELQQHAPMSLYPKDAQFIAALNPQVALALLDRIDACLKYSANHTDQMWAASIVGHLLGCDFRDAKEALKKYTGDVE